MILSENEHFKLIESVHPHIAKKLQVLWGSEGFEIVINNLFTDTRGGTRKGFSSDVASALFKLMTEHSNIHPECAMKVIDIWGI